MNLTKKHLGLKTEDNFRDAIKVILSQKIELTKRLHILKKEYESFKKNKRNDHRKNQDFLKKEVLKARLSRERWVDIGRRLGISTSRVVTLHRNGIYDIRNTLDSWWDRPSESDIIEFIKRP